MASAAAFPHIDPMTADPAMASVDTIIDDFELLDDWEDRYRYLIELGRRLEPLPEEAHNETNKVRGCASQVWLETTVEDDAGEPRLNFRGDSDAHIVRGLVYLILALYSGRTASEIGDTDAAALFERLGLTAHLTPQRSNGVRSMVERIRSDAREAAADADQSPVVESTAGGDSVGR
jgi:cysteine desulfuration protein SufE